MAMMSTARALRFVASRPSSWRSPVVQRGWRALSGGASSTEAGGAGDPAVHAGEGDGEPPSDDYAERPPRFSGAEEGVATERPPTTPPEKERAPPFAPSGKLGSQELAEGSSLTQKRRRHSSSSSAPAGEEEAAARGVREEDREYYRTHKPSPLAEVEFADTRKPVTAATDSGGGGEEDVAGTMVEDTADASLARAEEMFREAARRGSPAWPHSRALAAMLAARRSRRGDVQGGREEREDDIKARVEAICRQTVSCADILALAARDSVVALGGPSWTVPLGRRDSTTASLALANTDLPAPSFDVANLAASFAAKNLSVTDMVALSGGHTIGDSQCLNFRDRLYNETAPIDPSFAAALMASCPRANGTGDSNLTPLDTTTPTAFDNRYYGNLLEKKGLLHSDQVLVNARGGVGGLVRRYAGSPARFGKDFAAAMVRMGNVSPLTGEQGQIRLTCSRVN